MSNKKPIATLIIKRPSWESVKEAYSRINTANPYDEDLQEKFKQAIIENGRWRGFLQKTAEQKAQEIIDKIKQGDYDDNVWQRYALVGGYTSKSSKGIFGVLGEYIRHKNFFGKSLGYQDYGNTCALQVSYAFNYGGMPLHTKINEKKHNSIYGENKKYLYILGADSMGEFLNDVWGKPEVSAKATDSEKPAVLEKIKGKKGVVVMKGKYSHTTLWSGKNFVDVENGMARNYYLTNMGTAELYFWELKE